MRGQRTANRKEQPQRGRGFAAAAPARLLAPLAGFAGAGCGQSAAGGIAAGGLAAWPLSAWRAGLTLVFRRSEPRLHATAAGQALPKLDEGELRAGPRSWPPSCCSDKTLAYAEHGGPLFILGAITLREAEEQINPTKRQLLFLVAGPLSGRGPQPRLSGRPRAQKDCGCWAGRCTTPAAMPEHPDPARSPGADPPTAAPVHALLADCYLHLIAAAAGRGPGAQPRLSGVARPVAARATGWLARWKAASCWPEGIRRRRSGAAGQVPRNGFALSRGGHSARPNRCWRRFGNAKPLASEAATPAAHARPACAGCWLAKRLLADDRLAGISC